MKPQQIESQLQRVLSNAIAELRDPRIPLIVTVERVSVTSDFGIARVYLSALGDVPAMLDAVTHARGHLQREVARQVKLRRTPTLEFYPAGEAPL
ncbi:30S ribosome-binding factor RbfA [Deinococcus peraridilitoris]|uniref:Ribosome-binding factor A n=1 Tax=Deinococcus peraridilitoris (strain DSM 19664 / LMG 22246 / CIP 109416 / KR-200) TaxID=937777 RepID=L0A5E0_DEIPD|nr:30S ribosome-binding factor RbfA [Deinococcus peraridilitoris]AFZ68402.1 ribosome-binding factor A [Deinococcus peraridilitoris DSM 19664]